MPIPTYQLITPGGDWQSVGNFEYRIPIAGPITLALFTDAGINRILQPNQLLMDPAGVADLNSQFPQAGFSGKVQIAPGHGEVESLHRTRNSGDAPGGAGALPRVLRL